jgi:hypothetical protein
LRLSSTRGPATKTGARVTDTNLMDIAPTGLYAMQEPVPNEMDGRVLAEIFDEGTFARTRCSARKGARRSRASRRRSTPRRMKR